MENVESIIAINEIKEKIKILGKTKWYQDEIKAISYTIMGIMALPFILQMPMLKPINIWLNNHITLPRKSGGL